MQTYNQDLVGDGLGNVDFSMDGAVTEIHGVESLLSCKENIYRYVRINR